MELNSQKKELKAELKYLLGIRIDNKENLDIITTTLMCPTSPAMLMFST